MCYCRYTLPFVRLTQNLKQNSHIVLLCKIKCVNFNDERHNQWALCLHIIVSLTGCYAISCAFDHIICAGLWNGLQWIVCGVIVGLRRFWGRWSRQFYWSKRGQKEHSLVEASSIAYKLAYSFLTNCTILLHKVCGHLDWQVIEQNEKATWFSIWYGRRVWQGDSEAWSGKVV